MKLMYVIFCVIFGAITITCHVTDSTKNSDLSAPTQKRSPAIETQNETEEPIHNEIQEEESSVYLDDVLLKLKSQKWNDTEMPCLNQIYDFIHNLQNFTLWAVWDWDAFPSEPQGILYGNRYQFGNYDQCMKEPWSKTHPYLRTKYCLAEVSLVRADGESRQRAEKPLHPYQSALDLLEYQVPHTRALNMFTWGACVPAVCAPQTVERFLGVLLKRSHLGVTVNSNISITEECQLSGYKTEYEGPFYAFVIVIGSITLICLTCTYLNCQRKDIVSETTKSRIIKAFCIKQNALNLLQMKKEGTEVLYGIRYLSMCCIVLDHYLAVINIGSVSDGFAIDQDLQSITGLMVLHNDLFVDTFFVLSGFLTATRLAEVKKLPFIIILKRYVRLVIAYAVVIFYLNTVFGYTGDGPVWNRGIYSEVNVCRKNWWLNLLMVSNYVDTANVCLIISWYIPSDFHFFIVTVLTLRVYKRWPKLGILLAIVLTTGAIVLPGIINYMYELNALLPFTIIFLGQGNPRLNVDYQNYIRSHMRYASYLVGVYSGFIFLKLRNNRNLNRIKQKWSILGVTSAMALMLAVMMYGGSFLYRDYNPIETAVYAALNRPVWSCGLVLIILCCSFGRVPLVKSFLSWYPWVPLSRLSYGLYLTHILFCMRVIFATRNPRHNDFFEIVNSSIGVIFWGSIAALFMWLLTEAPANNLLNLCLQPRKKTTTNEELSPASLTPTKISERLHDNLPSTIDNSSKL